MVTAEFDPLRDQAIAYVARLRQAGVEVEHLACPGMIHGFFQMPALLDTAREVMDRSALALRAALAAHQHQAAKPS